LLDHLLAILAAAGQSQAQALEGWRQDEDALVGLDAVAHLGGSLPVDLEDDVDAAIQLLLHPQPRRAVEIAEDLRRLQEVPVFPHRQEHLTTHKVIVAAVDLTRAHGAGGMGDGDHQGIGMILYQCRYQAGLACAGRRGDGIEGTSGHESLFREFCEWLMLFGSGANYSIKRSSDVPEKGELITEVARGTTDCTPIFLPRGRVAHRAGCPGAMRCYPRHSCG